MVILKGYNNGREVWAVAHTYGSGETAETFFCYLEPTNEVKKEYERSKNVFANSRKTKRNSRGEDNNAKGKRKDLPNNKYKDLI